ncbi:MAG: UDP-3-O-(3-hydroxymyristoyl)glucosamine N-acyltransferase [Shimia sp.]
MSTPQSWTLNEIATALGAKALGAADIRITHAAEPADAGPDALAIATTPKYAEALPQGSARAALLWDGADWDALGLDGAICVARPRYAMSGMTRLMDSAWRRETGQHPTAYVDPLAEVAEDVVLGPFAVVAAGATVGPGTILCAHTSIGAGSRLGRDCYVREGARILHDVTMGDRVVVQPNAVIGSDGFSWVTPEASNAEVARETLGAAGGAAQSWARIHSLGGVEIADDVEIGAGCTIDRGTIRATRIGARTKLDNVVQIGHNAETGEDCLLCGHSGLSGSARIGNNVVLGGKSGVADNLTVGDNVVLGGATMVLSNVPAGRVMMGYPATQMHAQVESYKALRRLPRDMAALKKAVSKLTSSD